MLALGLTSIPPVLWISLCVASWGLVNYSSLCNTYGAAMITLFFPSVYWQYSACVCYMAGGVLLFIPLLLLLRVNPVITKKEWSELISQAMMIYRWFLKCTSKYIVILKLTTLHGNSYQASGWRMCFWWWEWSNHVTDSYHCAYQEGINPTLFLANKVIASKVWKELQNEAHKAAQRKLNNKD